MHDGWPRVPVTRARLRRVRLELPGNPGAEVLKGVLETL